MKGLFWNYYSVGLDAQAAYGFHSLREKRPWATPTRTINQGWYSFFSCTTGWFCKAPPVRNKVALKVRGAPAHRRDVWRPVPPGILLHPFQELIYNVASRHPSYVAMAGVVPAAACRV